MAEVHVLNDETLGGVKREYVEVTTLRNLPHMVRRIVNGVEVMPTDFVIIGGKRYRIEERLAEPGELILRKKNGLTYVVVERKGDFVTIADSSELLLEEDYVVLEPVEKSTEDIIANLVRRVAELERGYNAQRTLDGIREKRLAEISYNINGIKNDIETWAQEVETVKYTNEEIYSRLGHLEKDVDERLMAELSEDKPQTITLDIDTFTKLIGGVRG